MWNVIEQQVSCRDTKIKIDEACLEITSSSSSVIDLWKQVTECYMCRYLPWKTVQPNSTISVVVETEYPLAFMYSDHDDKFNCSITYQFEEYGVYTWNINESSCNPVILVEKPTYPFSSLLAAFIIVLLIILTWNLGKCILNLQCMARFRPSSLLDSELQSEQESLSSSEGAPVRRGVMPTVRGHRSRVLSLDVFRGICVALMIFVNYGGGNYWFFKHSSWNGLTVADLVFPWFLWIMGISLVISVQSQLQSSLPRFEVWRKVFKRSLVLIAIGLFINTLSACKETDLSNLRIPGVLQRIGVSYFIVGTLEAFMFQSHRFEEGHWTFFKDVRDAGRQWLAVIALCAVHLIVTFHLPVPGCPEGYLGPGGLERSLLGKDIYLNCSGGAAGYVDRMFFGETHIHQRPTFRNIYHTVLPYDPEGLLGTLTAVLNVYLGVQAGRTLVSYHSSVSRVSRWCIWGTLCGMIASILCAFRKDGGWIPVNKNLWSLSFVLITCSFAFYFLSCLYFLVDIRRGWKGIPFRHAGMNPLILYVGHEITKNKFPWSWKPVYGTRVEYLAIDMWGTLLWLLIAIILFKKGIFFSA